MPEEPWSILISISLLHTRNYYHLRPWSFLWIAGYFNNSQHFSYPQRTYTLEHHSTSTDCESMFWVIHKEERNSENSSSFENILINCYRVWLLSGLLRRFLLFIVGRSKVIRQQISQGFYWLRFTLSPPQAKPCTTTIAHNLIYFPTFFLIHLPAAYNKQIYFRSPLHSAGWNYIFPTAERCQG